MSYSAAAMYDGEPGTVTARTIFSRGPDGLHENIVPQCEHVFVAAESRSRNSVGATGVVQSCPAIVTLPGLRMYGMVPPRVIVA